MKVVSLGCINLKAAVMAQKTLMLVLTLSTLCSARFVPANYSTDETRSNSLKALYHAVDTAPAMISKEGYPAETHTVVTEDGYILEMHRIPYGRKSPKKEGVKRSVVFLQHGLLSSSIDWLVAGREKALGYFLADAGYDVWLGNFRGNTYGRQHLHLDPSHFKFWQFSWDHHGNYDLPAMLKHVLGYTKEENIFYVGHSMGTTSFMVMANMHPDLQKHIALANFLAPVAYVGHLKGPLRLAVPFLNQAENFFDGMKIGEFLPSNDAMHWISDLACKDKDILEDICSAVIFVLCGFDKAQMNSTLLHPITQHTPAGTSVHTMVQYGQEIKSNGFHAFDHGEDKNKMLYGTSQPRQYQVEKVTAPVAVYWGDNDWMAQPTDVLRTTSALPNLVKSYRVPFSSWNHLDFMYAIDAVSLVYTPMLKEMENKRAEVFG